MFIMAATSSPQTLSDDIFFVHRQPNMAIKMADKRVTNLRVGCKNPLVNSWMFSNGALLADAHYLYGLKCWLGESEAMILPAYK